MEYQFQFNISGQPVAEFSMDHEAFGIWLSDELGSNKELLAELLNIVDQLETNQIQSKKIIGSEMMLYLSRDDVEVSKFDADSMYDDLDQNDLPEETNLSDEGSFAACGLPDFRQVLESWQEFIG